MEEKEQDLTKTLKKSYKRSIFITIGILMISGLIFTIWNASHFQSTDDAYVDNHTVQVAPKVSGQVIGVYVKDNQKIKEGELIAKIDDADYRVRLQQAEANYEKALSAQNIAHANLSAAQSQIELAKKDLERYTKLYETGSVSKQQLDVAKTKYDNSVASIENAEQSVFSKDSKNVADADLKALKALRDQAQLNLSYTKIYAPQNGTITSKRVEKGAYVQVGSSLCVIVPDEVWVIANFKENQIGLMHAGQEVDIKIDTYPNKVFKGKVDSIQRASGAKSSLFPPENAVGSFVKIVQRIPVKILFTEEIDKNIYNIVPGMSVIPKVRVKK